MATSEAGYQVAELLYQTFSATDAQVRGQAEEQLKRLAGSPRPYAQALLSITASTLNTISTDLRNSASTQLRQTLSKACSSGELTISDRFDLAKAILEIMAQSQLSRGVLGNLGLCLNPLLDANSQDPDGTACKLLQSLIATQLSANGSQVTGMLKALRAVFSDVGNLQHVVDFYEQISPSLLAIGKQLLKKYREDGTTGEALEEWAFTINAIVQHFDVTTSSYLKIVIQDFQLADLLGQILQLETVDKAGVIAHDSGPLANAFNNCKAQLLASLTVLLTYLIEHKKKMSEETGGFQKIISIVGISVAPSPFVNCALMLVERYVMSTILLCGLAGLHQLLETSSLHNVLTQTLLFLHKCVSEAPFYSLFSDCYKAVIVGVCLPLLQCSPKELHLMTSDPEEFQSMAIDICEKQDTENLKTSAAQLMEGIVDCIDGALSFATYYLAQLIDFTAKGSAAAEGYSALVEMQDFPQILSSTEEMRVEVGLMGICVLSYGIQRRADLQTMLEAVLTTHFQTLTQAPSVLMQTRMCLLLYFYFDTMFRSHGMTQSCVAYLLRCLSVADIPTAVHLQACYTLSAILQEDEYEDRLTPHLPMIISAMVAVLPYQQNKVFFESVQEVIVSNVNIILEGLSPLLTGLVHKITSEVHASEQVAKREKTQSLIVTKCWNVIRTVLDSSQLTLAHLQLAEQLITPLFDFICAPEKIDFEDDIVLACTSLVKRYQAVSPLCWQVFERLPLVQRKYGGELRQVFSCLNVCIAYGHQTIIEKQAYLSQILEMCRECLFAQSPNHVNEAGCSQGAVLLQQLLLTLIGQYDQFLPFTLDLVLRRYAQGTTQTFLKIRLLDTLFAAVNYNPELTIRTLVSMNPTSVTDLIREIGKNQGHFFHSYDKKLATVCISRLLCLDPQPLEIAEASLTLLDTVISIISLQKPIPPTPRQNDVFEDLFLDSDDDLPIDSQSKARNEEAEASLMLTSMVTPLQDFDETDMFRKALNCLMVKPLGKLQAMMEALSQEKRKQLMDILQSRRLQVGASVSDSSTLRKIVKVRRHLSK